MNGLTACSVGMTSPTYRPLAVPALSPQTVIGSAEIKISGIGGTATTDDEPTKAGYMDDRLPGYRRLSTKACDCDPTTHFALAGPILFASGVVRAAAGYTVQALGGAGCIMNLPVVRVLRHGELFDVGADIHKIGVAK